MSSTSWTPDEDFSILLKAIQLLERTPEAKPNFLFIITGTKTACPVISIDETCLTVNDHSNLEVQKRQTEGPHTSSAVFLFFCMREGVLWPCSTIRPSPIRPHTPINCVHVKRLIKRPHPPLHTRTCGCGGCVLVALSPATISPQPQTHPPPSLHPHPTQRPSRHTTSTNDKKPKFLRQRYRSPQKRHITTAPRSKTLHPMSRKRSIRKV